MIEKVVRDGKVAVLVSPGYGAGWYSWNSQFPRCLFEPEIVELLERCIREDRPTRYAEIEIKRIAAELYGEGFYPGGGSDLEIQWVEQGTRFEIDEYDGSESLRVLSPEDGVIA